MTTSIDQEKYPRTPCIVHKMYKKEEYFIVQFICSVFFMEIARKGQGFDKLSNAFHYKNM